MPRVFVNDVLVVLFQPRPPKAVDAAVLLSVVLTVPTVASDTVVVDVVTVSV